MFNVQPEKVVKLDIVSIQDNHTMVLQYIHNPNKNLKRSPYVEGMYVARYVIKYSYPSSTHEEPLQRNTVHGLYNKINEEVKRCGKPIAGEYMCENASGGMRYTSWANYGQ